jgi:thiosulfate/3-mercaptopyruvate sulfurtransferase
MYTVCHRKSLVFFIFILLCCVFFKPRTIQASDIRLIEASRLNQSLSEYMVLDARPKKEWLAAHIPGAGSFCWEDYTRTDEKGVAYRTLPPEKLAQALAKMGIHPHKPVAVYGDADTSWGGEGWVCWSLSWIGHKGPVRVVAGGIQAWEEKGFSLKSGPETFRGEPPVYPVQVQDSLNITAKQIHNRSSAIQLVDTRSTMEWLKGHLPGAVHIRWKKFYQGKDRRPVGSARLRALLEDKGINPEQPVVYYCTGGIRSGYAWLVHHLAKLPEAVNFEGGTVEWDKTFSK